MSAPVASQALLRQGLGNVVDTLRRARRCFLTLNRGRPALNVLRLRIAYRREGTKKEEDCKRKSPSMKHSSLHIVSEKPKLVISFGNS